MRTVILGLVVWAGAIFTLLVVVLVGRSVAAAHRAFIADRQWAEFVDAHHWDTSTT